MLHGAYTDCFSIDTTNLLLHREYIKQRLCRMLTNSIASVDHWLTRVFGRHLLTTNNHVTYIHTGKSSY